jgi:thiol-disulfide isomerase/thioredoxin
MKMKQFIASGVAAWFVVLSVSANAASLKLGELAPMAGVKMKNVDGKEASIADVAGKNGTLVVFTCNHCPFAKAWEGRLAEIGNAYKEKGVGVIAINANDPSAFPEDSFDVMQQRAKEKGYQFPYAVDGTSDIARAFGATRTPEAFLFNKDGKLVYHGAIDDDQDATKVTKNFLRDALDALIDGKTIPVSETKFIGCSIKYRPKA